MTKKTRKLLFGTCSWKRPFMSIIAIYLLLLVFALFFSNRVIFQPPKPNYDETLENLIYIPNDTGQKIAAVYYPPVPGYPTLLWSHGNGEDLDNIKPLTDYIESIGYGLLAYDYPGYGLSEGKPTEKSVDVAAEASYNFLRKVADTPANEIILCGQSVGSGPTCHLAARNPHRAVVLLAPFYSAFRTVTRIPLFPGDSFPNGKNLSHVTSPLLVVHGTADRIIPFSQGKKLFEHSPSPNKRFLPIEGAGHNELYALGETKIFNLLEKITQETNPERNNSLPHKVP